jgi:hypothetical protein
VPSSSGWELVNAALRSSNGRLFFGLSLGLHVAVGIAVYGKHASSPRSSDASLSAPAETKAQGPEALFKGNTFEIPIDVPLPVEPTLATPAAVSQEESPVDSPSNEPSPTRAHPRRARAPKETEARTDPAGDGTGTSGAVFGAIGERASIDLATAFTRGFPQAASADPAWALVPYGSAGEALVVLEIDETGSLVDSHIEGSPSPALKSGLARTLALIRARTFTAKARTTRLHVTARVSPDEVHDGLHGEVFAIGGSFAAAEGQAFFALAIGRRIDLRVSE